MRVTPLELKDVLLIEPALHRDSRGRLFEAWEKSSYSRQVTNAEFVQDNVTVTAPGVVRGLHFQHPNGQGKLITVVTGAAYDVVVDVRRGSPTFGEWVAEELSAENGLQLWIPAGFAHGFQALYDGATLMYKATARWQKENDRAIHHADPVLAITWPLEVAGTSPKDAAAPLLSDMPAGQLPAWS